MNPIETIQKPPEVKSPPEAIQKSHFGKLEYWERRYKENDKPFDWYQKYDSLKDIITQYITKNSQIMNIGCGNSTLSEDMLKEGYQMIANVDFSKLVIAAMQEKYKDTVRSFFYTLCDCKSLPAGDGQIDCVIDKGLLDSVLSGDYSFQNTKRVVDEVYRVLNKQTGCYIVVSHGFPDNRLPYLKKDKYNWTLSVHKVYKPDVVTNSLEFNAEDLNNYHFIYVCKMNKDSHMHKLIPS